MFSLEYPVELDITEIKPVVVTVKMYPFVSVSTAKGTLRCTETVYVSSQAEALAEVLESYLDARW